MSAQPLSSLGAKGGPLGGGRVPEDLAGMVRVTDQNPTVGGRL